MAGGAAAAAAGAACFWQAQLTTRDAAMSTKILVRKRTPVLSMYQSKEPKKVKRGAAIRGSYQPAQPRPRSELMANLRGQRAERLVDVILDVG
jgi:hypothetical protein